jgi:predicted adenylyl cyclase CyaB
MIEAEIRSFISEQEYSRLLEFFKEQCEQFSEDTQETHYFDTPVDLRIQQNETYAKIWLKKGNLHDDAREEIEVRCKKEEFTNLSALFDAMGYEVKIKWFRTRHTFLWEDITVTVDFTKGYGYIIELEQLVDEGQQDQALVNLKQKLTSLNIKETPKDEFQKKYEYYAQHWKELV